MYTQQAIGVSTLAVLTLSKDQHLMPLWYRKQIKKDRETYYLSALERCVVLLGKQAISQWDARSCHVPNASSGVINKLTGLSLQSMGTVLLSNPEPIKNVSKNNYGWSTVFDVALIRKQKLKHSYKTRFTCWTGDLFLKFRFGTGDRLKKVTKNMCMHYSSTIQSRSKQQNYVHK